MTIRPDTAPRIGARVQAWGNSMGLRITRAVAEMAGLERGTLVTIEAVPEGLLIRKRQAPERTWSEDELLEGLTPYGAHADELPGLLPHETAD